MWRRPYLVYFVTFLLVLGFVGWHLLVGVASDKPGSFYNNDENAVWIQHSWIDTEYSWEQIADLVHSFEEHKIKYVYVHAGPFEGDGTVPEYRYVYAKHFVDRAKAINPNIEYYAWLGQKREGIGLDDETVRKRVLDVTREFVEEIGYDGVHYDFEGLRGYDSGFVALAREYDEMTDAPLSITIDGYLPGYVKWGVSLFEEVDDSVTGKFVKDTTDYVDQYVVMPYEIDAQSAWFYTWLVKQEVIGISRLIPEENVLVAVITYDEQRPSFNADAENIATGLEGVIGGLNNSRAVKSAIKGVAIYANWETDLEEWKTYGSMWLGN